MEYASAGSWWTECQYQWQLWYVDKISLFHRYSSILLDFIVFSFYCRQICPITSSLIQRCLIICSLFIPAPPLTKHCQRHNRHKDWVQLTKATYFSHITSSNTNLIKFHLQNIDQAPTSKSRYQPTSASRLNLKFKILTKPGFRNSTKIQLHNFYKTSAVK